MTAIRRWDLRPLDPVRSVKAKLALLVGGSTAAGVLSVWLALDVLGWRARYGAAAALVVALAVTQVLARGMTSPLRQMTAAARAMAAGGPVPATPAVRTTSRDEVGELARAFTAMARDLATADAQRRELLANVTHELRTPVTALRAQLENLVDGVSAADAAALADLLDQVESLGELVDDLLDLARAEGAGHGLDLRPVDVRELAEQVARSVRAARPGPDVRVHVPSGLVALADPHRLRQVLTNLVDNAARHASASGRVDVTAGAGPDGGLVVEVADDGPGIAPEHRRRVFERFERGPAATGGRSGDGGTGLGLAIARWAVELHGGRIDALDVGTGCRIRVRLPAPSPPSPPS